MPVLGYSRGIHVRAFRNERQESWFEGLARELRSAVSAELAAIGKSSFEADLRRADGNNLLIL